MAQLIDRINVEILHLFLYESDKGFKYVIQTFLEITYLTMVQNAYSISLIIIIELVCRNFQKIFRLSYLSANQCSP